MSRALLGILLALIPMLFWGFGDFFIQRSTRKVGDVKALFFIGLAAFIFIFPFIYHDLYLLKGTTLLLLLTLAVITFFGSLFDFEALREGKIAVIEPLIGLELPITVSLGVLLHGEHVSPWQGFLIVVVFFGILFAITRQRSHLHYHERLLEKGVLYAGLGAIGMALTSLLVGIASETASPLLTIWFSHSMLAVFCGLYLLKRGEFFELWTDLKRAPRSILAECFFDNAAWIAYGYSTTFLPISITITFTESYIALAAWLGIRMNHEKLRKHQIFGVILATLGIIALAYVTAT